MLAHMICEYHMMGFCYEHADPQSFSGNPTIPPRHFATGLVPNTGQSHKPTARGGCYSLRGWIVAQ